MIAPPLHDESAPTEAALAAVKKRNLLTVAHDQQLLEEADERVFQALRVPEDLRASIREINEEYGEGKRAQLGADVPGRTGDEEAAAAEAVTGSLDRARGVALEELLGTDPLREFESAEREALGRSRERFRGWAERVGAHAKTTPAIDFAARR